MGITYEVDSTRGVVIERWSGAITADDIARHWRQLLGDERALACGKSFADVRDLEPRFSGEELLQLVKTIVEPGLANRRWKSAILVHKPHQFGIARQYQVFAEVYSDNDIFTDEAAARAWIGL